MKIKVTTYTTRVLETLRAADDFLTREMVAERCPDCSRDQIHAALCHLRKHRAVDVVIEPDGLGWWFALPEGSDDRVRVVEERTPESEPRRRRKKASDH